jgi:hypothetical protein
VPEGLSPTEVGKELGEHAAKAAEDGPIRHRHDRVISVIEAVLLSVVTITAAWSGYSAAKWGTESSLQLAKASATRSNANRAYQEALTLRVQDASNFNAWFSAYLAGKKGEEQVAERRFRSEYDVAFRAWLATKPFTNPSAPKGPQYMPQYNPAGTVHAKLLDAQANGQYAKGQEAAVTGDKYVRVTVILASVLFIVGISSHFPTRGIRIGLVAVGAALLIFGSVEILQLPGPPA